MLAARAAHDCACANSRDFEGDSKEFFQEFVKDLQLSLITNINHGGKMEYLFQDIRRAFMSGIANRFIFFELTPARMHVHVYMCATGLMERVTSPRACL